MKKHVVAPGEELKNIASLYGISPEEIISATPSVFTIDRERKAKERGLGRGGLIYPQRDVLNIPDSEMDQLRTEQIDQSVERAPASVSFVDRDSISLYLDDAELGVSSLKFTEYYDRPSDSFSFLYPYNPNNPSDVELFKPWSLKEVRIYIGGSLGLRGVAETMKFSVGGTSRTVDVAGRSSTLLLEKSEPPPTLQREFIELTLREIAEIVAESLGLAVVTDVPDGPQFSRAGFSEGQTCYEFLAELAKAQGVLISNNEEGNVTILRYEQKKSTYTLLITGQGGDGASIPEASLTFDTTGAYGTYVAQGQSPGGTVEPAIEEGGVISQQTTKYINVSGVSPALIGVAAVWEATKAYRDAFNCSVDFPGWINPGTGERWRAGEQIDLKAPGLGIENSIPVMIEWVEFNLDRNKKYCTLKLIPIISYS